MSETTQQEIVAISIPRIRPSAVNPRKTVDADKLAELAESVRRDGVQQPIVVREAAHKGTDYEIVFGERRWRASKLAGLDTIPAIVRDVTAERAYHLRMIENLQREDLHPLEEADGFAAMVDGNPSFGFSKPCTVASIAEETGKSQGYIYGRLKLRQLAAGPRKAYVAGKISTGIALKLARVPTKELQEQALEEIIQGVDDGTGGVLTNPWPMNDETAAQHLLENYTLSLGTAAFDTTDSTLPGGACEPCPSRSGNQALLFPDVKRKDVCTNPACFKEKTAAAYERKVAEAKKAGGRELGAGVVKKLYAYGNTSLSSSASQGYAEVDSAIPEDPKGRSWKALLGADLPKLYIANVEGAPRELIKTADGYKALQARKDLKWAKRAAGAVEAAKEKADPKARAADQEKRMVSERANEYLIGMVIGAVVAYAEKKDDVDLIRLMIGSALEDWRGQEVAEGRLKKHWPESKDAKLKGYQASRAFVKRLDSLSDAELRGILAEILIGSAIAEDHTGKRETMKAAAKIVGLDLADQEKAAKAAAAGSLKDAELEASAAGVKAKR